MLDIVAVEPGDHGSLYDCQISRDVRILEHGDLRNCASSRSSEALPAERPVAWAASLQVARRATSAGGRCGLRGPVRPVRNVLPLAVADVLVIHAEAYFFPFDEDRGKRVRYQPAAFVEQEIVRSIALGSERLEQQHGAIG